MYLYIWSHLFRIFLIEPCASSNVLCSLITHFVIMALHPHKCILVRSVGIHPLHYLSVDLDSWRDENSWWCKLTPDHEQATKWDREQSVDGSWRFSCEMGGWSRVYLTAHGSSRGGSAELVHSKAACALVHRTNDDNSLWGVFEKGQQTPGHATRSISLRKAKGTNEGFVLTGVCYPDQLYVPRFLPSTDSLGAFWRPVPIYNTIVKPVPVHVPSGAADDMSCVWDLEEVEQPSPGQSSGLTS